MTLGTPRGLCPLQPDVPGVDSKKATPACPQTAPLEEHEESQPQPWTGRTAVALGVSSASHQHHHTAARRQPPVQLLLGPDAVPLLLQPPELLTRGV